MKRSEVTNEQERLDYIRHRQIKFKYGITLEEYNLKFVEQNGCCSICGRHQSDFKRRLHIDHNHNTGEIRDLLCPNCNVIVGKCGENIKLLSKIADYLEKWRLVE